jgi:hypothetical protein
MIDITTSSFFISYTTPSEFNGNIPVSSIIDMVSYNFLPPFNSTIQYNVGAATQFTSSFRIKNMTTNTPLAARFSSSADFLFSTQSATSASILTTTILPLEEKIITIYSNNITFDNYAGNPNASATFDLKVSSNTGPQVLRSATATPLVIQEYSSSISVI